MIGFDLLRVSIPKVTTVDILTSTDAAEIILDVVNLGLENINVENPALLMMILKVLNNLVGTTLFVQLYMTLVALTINYTNTIRFSRTC